MNDDVPARPRRRAGCLGSLLGLAALAAVCLAVAGVFAYVVAPWNFNFGGHFHPLGGWQGQGRFHSATAGGDYDMWLNFDVTVPQRLRSPLKGTAVLCTPRGERLVLTLSGDMPRDHGADLANVPLHLYLHRLGSLANTIEARHPHIDLYGAFGDSVLNVEDRGSIGTAFGPDGAVRHSLANVKQSTENIHITFKEVSRALVEPIEAAEQTREQDDAITLLEHDREQLRAVERALASMDDGHYGVSAISGKPIPYERLLAVPWTDRDNDQAE
ncbi:MAG: hypothetical protein ABUS79_16675 [Pseudomonadota bacterium]